MTAEDTAEMERMGDYVRRALPAHPLLRPLTGWKISVKWDKHRLVGSLRRSDLVITEEVHGDPWWRPVSRYHAKDITSRIARVLHGWVQESQA